MPVSYNLIYVHIGTKEPEYIFDSIYQTLLVSPSTKIYILINSALINTFQNKIDQFNINLYTKSSFKFNLNIEYISLEILDSSELNKYHKLSKSILNKETLEFRDRFWVSTTTRFFYLARFIELFQLKNCIHIENDIMIYTDLNKLNILSNLDENLGLCFVQDNPVRVVPSIIFIKRHQFIKELIDFILNEIEFTKRFQNDMDLLGKFSLERTDIVLKFPENFNSKNDNYLFDGAAIGQFLGGVDPRNLEKFTKGNSEQKKMIMFNNPSKSFINETSTFKPNEIGVKIFRKNTFTDTLLVPLKLVYATKETPNKISLKEIVNLHIHSKQLYQFSSIFNLNYSDIITGDRICSLCDFILTTEEIYSFHKNLENFINPDNIIIIKNFNSINIDGLNSILLSTGKKTIKLFIYTHMLTGFTKNILFKLSTKLKYHIYLHNSDHALDDTASNYNKLKDANHITKVYSQNIGLIKSEEPENNKFNILPIGLENSMWNSSNILTLYEIMSKSYLLSKTKNLYININPKTFAYRQTVLDKLTLGNFNITTTRKPFNEYLQELSTHRFCLCIRGNGVSTHREWESLYLGVIPVFINNKFTDNNTHIRYFEKLNLPFYEITEENFDKYSDDFFNERLYKKIIKKCGESIYNLDALKLSYYAL